MRVILTWCRAIIISQRTDESHCPSIVTRIQRPARNRKSGDHSVLLIRSWTLYACANDVNPICTPSCLATQLRTRSDGWKEKGTGSNISHGCLHHSAFHEYKGARHWHQIWWGKHAAEEESFGAVLGSVGGGRSNVDWYHYSLQSQDDHILSLEPNKRTEGRRNSRNERNSLQRSCWRWYL